MSEAVEAVGEMLKGYPNARDGMRGGYVGTMAELFTRYPRELALRCTDPINGVAREAKYIPTVSEAVRWLEREVTTYRGAYEWEQRAAMQLADRKRFEEEDTREPLEHRRKVASRILGELKQAFANGTLQTQQRSKADAWKRLSDVELLAVYPSPHTKS